MILSALICGISIISCNSQQDAKTTTQKSDTTQKTDQTRVAITDTVIPPAAVILKRKEIPI